MKPYSITTQKTWSQTTRDIEQTMNAWGVSDWSTNYPRGARSESYREQPIEDRTVTLTYVKDGKPVTLSMGLQARAVENIRVLYIAVEAMRMNERRGITDLIKDAYLQIAGPVRERSPYEILGIYPGSPLPIAEAAYKVKARELHPDAGGFEQDMKDLNQAIQILRDEAKRK